MAAAADEKPTGWTLDGHLEAGITFNPAQPAGSSNFGNSFGDKANQLLLNQAMLDLERHVPEAEDEIGWGITLQGMFGTDSRYTHNFGEFQRLTHSRDQFDLLEASFQLHVPQWALDVKFGQFMTPIGYETIDATANGLYSHSYIFNFGDPYKQVGMLATGHLSSGIDLYFGLDSGENGGWWPDDYNNTPIKLTAGIGATLADGDLTLLLLSHIGADHPPGQPRTGAGESRQIDDLVMNWKVSPQLTLSSEVNYSDDRFFGAVAYGVAQYATYTRDDGIKLIGRAELWRDNGGAFTASYPGFFDFVAAERGQPSQSIGGGRTLYGELTFGANLPFGDHLLLRPEFRWDASLNNTHPFERGRSASSVTPAIDAIIKF